VAQGGHEHLKERGGWKGLPNAPADRVQASGNQCAIRCVQRSQSSGVDVHPLKHICSGASNILSAHEGIEKGLSRDGAAAQRRAYVAHPVQEWHRVSTRFCDSIHQRAANVMDVGPGQHSDYCALQCTGCQVLPSSVSGVQQGRHIHR
jgi:hypothetical protein